MKHPFRDNLEFVGIISSISIPVVSTGLVSIGLLAASSGATGLAGFVGAFMVAGAGGWITWSLGISIWERVVGTIDNIRDKIESRLYK